LLSIPPEHGYGPRGVPQAGIGGEDNLVFVVDIDGVECRTWPPPAPVRAPPATERRQGRPRTSLTHVRGRKAPGARARTPTYTSPTEPTRSHIRSAEGALPGRQLTECPTSARSVVATT